MNSPITLTYETTLADLVEPAFRLYTRRKSYQVNKWRNLVICAAGFMMLGFFGFKSKETVNLPLICVVAGAWGALMIHVTYPRAVRRGLEKYISKEVGDALPFATECQLSNDRLVCTNRGTSVTYLLSDLEGVSNDDQHLELSFGTKGLCLVPLRAFADEAQHAAFLTALSRS